MTPPQDAGDHGSAPRAVLYARANQSVDRYRHPVHRGDRHTVAAASPPRPGKRMLNRKRLWFFTCVLALALVLGGATLSAVLAGPPAELAKEPGPVRPGADGHRATRTTGPAPPGAPAEPGADSGVDSGVDDGASQGAERGGRADPAAPAIGPAAPSPDAGTGAGQPGGNGAATADGPGNGSGRANGNGNGNGNGRANGNGNGRANGRTTGDAGDPGQDADVTYQNCNRARRAGAAPLHRGEPGYSARLDPDGDGIACD